MFNFLALWSTNNYYRSLWSEHLVLLHPVAYCWRRRWHPTPVLLPGESHGRRSLVSCSPWGREESDVTEWLPFHFSLSCIGEGNGNPLQCSCLENPRDVGAWWAAVYGVTQTGGHDWSDLAAAVAYCNNFFYLFSDSKALSPRLYHSESSEVKWSEVTQSCPTLCNPMDCSVPGSSVHGILQAKILECVAISFSTGSSQPRDRTEVSHIAVRHFTLWATREAPYLNKGT